MRVILVKFQSTLPVRGATGYVTVIDEEDAEFQSTLPVRGATRIAGKAAVGLKFQSTLPVRGATGVLIFGQHEDRFQSTLPVRGATTSSPHRLPQSLNFNPRSPCGERRSNAYGADQTILFQSTLPVRGATKGILHGPGPRLISIHAPRAGSDGKIRQNTGCILAK